MIEYYIQKKSGKYLAKNSWGNFSLNYNRDKALVFLSREEAYAELYHVVFNKPKFGKVFWIVRREVVRKCELLKKELVLF